MKNSLKDFLSDFQRGYKEKDVKNIRKFVEDFFIDDAGLVFLGTRLNDWGKSYEGVESIIRDHWTDKNVFGEFDFKFEEAKIIETNEAAFVCSIGELEKNRNEESVYEKCISDVNEILEEDSSDELKVLRATKEIVGTLKNIEEGTKYKNPIRITMFITKTNDEYKIHQLQFSFDAIFLWQHRYSKEEEILPIFNRNEKQNNSKEIVELLENFQKGYIERDLNKIDEFTKLFTMNDDMITIGTDVEEFFIGPEGLIEVLEGDWEYWGDFKLNIEDAVVVEHENTAFFTTEAMIKQSHEIDVMRDSAVKLCKANIEDEDIKNNKLRLLEALNSMSTLMYEGTKGKDYYAPMRFSGFLVKKNHKWLFSHVQYSDYIKRPEKRL